MDNSASNVRISPARRGFAALAALVVAVAFNVVIASPALAATGLGGTVEFPTPVTVGDTGLPASIQFVNISNGDEANGVVNVDNPRLTPACTSPTTGDTCTTIDPGVFAVSATGTGTGNWTGINFNIVATGTPGVFEFVPDAPLTLESIFAGGDGSATTGGVDFTIDVLTTPTDSQGGAAGLQTEQLVTANAQHDTTGITGGGFGRDTTTVEKVPTVTVTTIHLDDHTPAPTLPGTNPPVAVVEVGTTVHDFAEVSPTAGSTTPTGDVTFSYRENFDCSGAATATDVETLTDLNSDGTAEADSREDLSVTPTVPGGYSFEASYSGDANHLSSDSDCEPLDVVDLSISIANDGVNRVNETHDFVITVTEHGQGGDQPVQGATPTVSFPTTGAPGSVDTTDCDNGTDASGQCTITINSTVTGTFTAVASVTHTVQTLSLTRDTDPATASIGAGQVADSEATKVYVDARIKVEVDDVNEVGDAHTFTVTVQGDAGAGSGFQGVSGVVPSVTANPVPDVTFDTSDCDAGTDGNGQCEVVVNSSVPTQIDVDASATVDFVLSEGSESVTVDTKVDNGNYDPADGTLSDPDVTGEKDYVDLSITISPDDTNEVGDPHTFIVTVIAHNSDGTDNPVDGATPTVTLTDSNGAVNQVSANTCTDGTGGANDPGAGQCSITFTSDSVGTVTGNASVTSVVEGVSMTRSTSGNAGPQGSGPAVKDFVNLSISIANDGVNRVNETHDFVITVTEHRPTGDSPAVGATPGVSFPGTGAPGSVDTTDCDNGTDASGQCTITINSTVTGTFTAVASVTHTVEGVSMTRATNGNSGQVANSDATKVYVDARIKVEVDDVNEVGDAHTFTVTVQGDAGAGSGFQGVSGVVPSVTANPVPDVTFDTSDCDAGTDGNGQCEVVVNSSVPTQIDVDASATVDFVLSEGSESVTVDTKVDNGNYDPADGTLSDPDVTGEKDYVDLSITIAPDDTNEVRDGHTFIVTVIAHNSDGTDNPVDGATPTVTLVNSNGAAQATTDNTCANGTGGADDPGAGQCSITFASPSAGVVTGNASVTTDVEGVSITRSTSGNSGPQGSGAAVKQFVDARVFIEEDATNFVGDPHTFLVRVQVNDGLGGGFVNTDAGTVGVTLTDFGSANGAANVSVNTCADGITGNEGDAVGTCRITFVSDFVGTTVGHGIFDINVTGAGGTTVSLHRETGGTANALAGGSDDAVKQWINPGCLVIMDEDGLDNDAKMVEEFAHGKYGTTPDHLIGDDNPDEGKRDPLVWNNLVAASGDTDFVRLETGEVDDEGWYALPPEIRYVDDHLPNPGEPGSRFANSQEWIQAFIDGTLTQEELDKIADVMPIRDQDLVELIGQTCTAIVYDSDISMNYEPIYANLQGEQYGTFTFRIHDVAIPMADYADQPGNEFDLGPIPASTSSTQLYDVILEILPPAVPAYADIVDIHDHEPDSIEIDRARVRNGTLTIIGSSDASHSSWETGTTIATVSVEHPDETVGGPPGRGTVVFEAPMNLLGNNRFRIDIDVAALGLTRGDMRGMHVHISTDHGGAYNVRM